MIQAFQQARQAMELVAVELKFEVGVFDVPAVSLPAFESEA